MSRIASLFISLLALLIILLLLYETSSPSRLVKFKPRVHHAISLTGQLPKDSNSLSVSSVDASVFSSEAQSSIKNEDHLIPQPVQDTVKEMDGPVHVIVLARMRTGSTLCGEILNQNANLFYLFEPLHALKVLFNTSPDTSEEKRMASTELLRKLYNCKFPRYFISSLSRWGIGKGKSHSVLPLCKQTDGCKLATPDMFQQVCEARGHVALKAIRANIKMLKPLVKSFGINLKIIHLMRDPRGTANSRRSYYSPRDKKQSNVSSDGEPSLKELELLSTSPEVSKNTVPKLCDWMRETLEDALEQPKWLKGRYKLIRYEDLAKEPIRLSRDIYSFLGLDMPANVMSWVKENTEDDDSHSKRQFSTHKNSTQASTSWRNKLSIEDVFAVQRICGDVMESLGYRKINSLSDLKNLSAPVVEPIDIDKNIMLT